MSTALALLHASCGDAKPVASPSAPNLLLLTVDTLRADHLASYGYSRETSPSIDALARRGVRFANHQVQQSSTWPSLTSIMTSRYPHQHGVVRNGSHPAPGQRMLAEILREHGYATSAFLANMSVTPHPGFDVVEGFRDADRDAAATGAALAWLRAHRDERFFLWLHLIGPHDPYEPGAPFAERFRTDYRGELDGRRATLARIRNEKRVLEPPELDFIVSLYDGDVAEADARIGTMLDALRELQLEEKTLVVFTSDHGELLYDRHFFFLHAEAIHSGVLDVPLILSLPGILPTNRVVHRVVESLDIAPTILELVDIDVPTAMQGKSLLPFTTESEPHRAESELERSEEPAAFSVIGNHIRAVRTRRWLYIENDRPEFTKSFPIASRELYDLVADPRNQTNVVDRHPELASQLQQRLRGWWARSGEHAAPPPSPRTPSPEIDAELRALGYIEDPP